MNLFTLTGNVVVDNSEANKSISKTGEEAEGLGSKLKNGIATAGKWAAGIAGAATMVGGAMVAAAKDTAADMDVIDKASQRMKIGAEAYQELAYAAGMSGVEMSVMEKAAKKLEGTDINMEEAMNSIMALTTEEERMAAAADLFGETVAYQMTPLINVGAEGMQQLKDDAHNLGLVMSQEAVSNGAAMGDMFSNVEQSLSSLKNGLMAEFMPYVMEILQWVIDNIPKIKETVGKVMDAIIPIVRPILDGVMALLPPVLDKVKALLDWLIPYLEPIMNGLTGIIQAFFKLINGDTEGFAEDIKTALTTLGEALFGIGEDMFNFLWEGIKNVWANIKGWMDEKVAWIKDKLTFWKQSNDSMKTDGSHAAGLNYVPYDGYVAELHRGETVLNAGATQSMVSDIINGIKDNIGSGRSSGPIELSINLDGRTLAHQLYPSLQYEGNRRGASFA